jgi:hypothetical protein
MMDWDGGDRPPADMDLAERAIAAAQRRRTRRTVIVGAGLLAAFTAVAIPVLSGLSTGNGAEADPTRPVDASRYVPTHTVAAPASARARIYAAALTNGPHPQRIDAPLYVRDQVCATVVTKPGAPCDDAAIPVAVQREVSRLVGPTVRFAANPRVPLDAGDRAVIVFGRLTIKGDGATLGIEVLCGPLCGQGQTLVLSERVGQWRVTGTTGAEWIS